MSFKNGIVESLFRYKYLIIIIIYQCSLYNIVTESSNLTNKDRPNSNEGIAVFHFESNNKAPLPNELIFKRKKKDSERKHFTLSSWRYTKKSNRYIILKKGTYSFKNIVYKFNGNIIEYFFPSNTFKIMPNKINYIGDIIFSYSRKQVKVSVQDKMKKRMLTFYKKYPKISVEYLIMKNLLVIEDPFRKYEISNDVQFTYQHKSF